MKERHRSLGSLILALVIILGSAWIGLWRAQRQDRAPDSLASSRPLQVELASELAATIDADADPEAEPEPEDTGEVPSEVVAAAPPAPASAVSAEELASLIGEMQAHVQAGRLLEPAQDSAFVSAARILGVDPQNEFALEVLDRVLSELRDVSTPVLPESLIAMTQRALALVPAAPEDPALAETVRQALAQSLGLAATLTAGERQLAREGAGPRAFASALESFRAALSVDPANARALKGLEEVQRRLLERALAAAFDLRFRAADSLLSQAEGVQVGTSRVLDARSQVMAFRSQTEATQLAAFKDAVAASKLDAAEAALVPLRKLFTDPKQIQDLESKLVNARLYGGFAAQERFADSLPDGSRGPRMGIVPVGSFRMGSPDTERARSKNEGPARDLSFGRGFALARSEVSVLEFRAFVDATGHTTDAEKLGVSAIYDEKTGRMTKTKRVNWRRSYNGSRARDSDPVVHISWNDANAYARWLAAQTVKPYRLPTEAEFEYALRAGGSGTFPWGEADPAAPVANVAGASELSRAGRRWSNGLAGYDDGHWGPAPVRSFAANAFRFYDLDGNVSEWVEDCWHDDYLRAPEQPIAWVNPGCELHVLRGGSWGSGRDQIRSAWRGSAIGQSSGARVGFRVARDL